MREPFGKCATEVRRKAVQRVFEMYVRAAAFEQIDQLFAEMFVVAVFRGLLRSFGQRGFPIFRSPALVAACPGPGAGLFWQTRNSGTSSHIQQRCTRHPNSCLPA